ncbi:MAG: hypothetical protein KAH38_09665, partial [Candidatus Hydrogenedentes bacterium]|nr:hypothetical protein [Candidatus Hydrogenedentota bacterium]
MRKCWKYLFYLGVLLLWLLVIVVVLELWTRWQYHCIETRNPFVVSRTQGAQWPIEDARSNVFSAWLLDEDLRMKYRGDGKSKDSLLPISPEWEMQNRQVLFQELDEWEQGVFSNLYKISAEGICEGVSCMLKDDLWEVPFFLYRKHVRRKELVNVLGLTEDFYSNNHGFRDMDF